MIKTLYKTFRLFSATLVLLSFHKPAYGPPRPYEQDLQWQCLVSAVYHEARGEPAKGKRAVLEVVFNRSKRSGKTFCEVVAEKRQFPWMKKKGLVELTPDTLKHYTEAVTHEQVFKSEKYIYFNSVKPFGVECLRIHKHTFCKEN